MPRHAAPAPAGSSHTNGSQKASPSQISTCHENRVIGAWSTNTGGGVGSLPVLRRLAGFGSAIRWCGMSVGDEGEATRCGKSGAYQWWKASCSMQVVTEQARGTGGEERARHRDMVRVRSGFVRKDFPTCCPPPVLLFRFLHCHGYRDDSASARFSVFSSLFRVDVLHEMLQKKGISAGCEW